MRRTRNGPSIYYANDKNIFDALNEHKVNAETVASLFEGRNTIVSDKESREELALYFSGLIHDYYDHKEIADKLGVVPRRERVTSMDIVISDSSSEHLDDAISRVSVSLQEVGDVVTTTRVGKVVTLHVEYTVFDYRRSEFNQVQTRDGLVEFHPTNDGYTVRSTQNESINAVRETLLAEIGRSAAVDVGRREVSLMAHPDPETRSRFFFDLFSDLPGYKLVDVTDVYVYKPTEFPENEAQTDVDSHVEKVFLKGTGVTRSNFLSDLAQQDYFTVRVGWKAQDSTSFGNVYAIEAVFADPKDCTGFSFIVLGVHERNGLQLMKQRRSPSRGEVSELSRAIELRAHQLIQQLASAAAEEG